MSITATEFKMNLKKYLELARTEDVFITRNGKIVAKLTKPFEDRTEKIKTLFGCVPDNISLEEAKAERLSNQ